MNDTHTHTGTQKLQRYSKHNVKNQERMKEKNK